MDLGLRDRACIVTGASGGIGGATAELLAHEGAAIVLVGRREDRLGAVAERCTELGGRAVPLVADLTAADAGDRVVEACEQEFGQVDALVNSAGTTSARSL